MRKIFLLLAFVVLASTANAANKTKKSAAKKPLKKIDLTIGNQYSNDLHEYNKMTYSNLENYKNGKAEEGISIEPEFKIIDNPTYSGRDDLERAKEFRLKFKYGF